MNRIVLLLLLFFGAACGGAIDRHDQDPRRIISLDFCADQYVLAFANRDEIAGLSPDATKSFSYFREEAAELPAVRPIAEDILLKKPDIVVRTYGGGPNIKAFLARAGIEVIQIPFASDITTIKAAAIETSKALGHESRGAKAIAGMDKKLSVVSTETGGEILYLTAKGAVAGKDTLIGELISGAGRVNFETRKGWRTLPLEALAYDTPDAFALGFFDGSDAKTDQWSPARHPVTAHAMENAEIIDIPGAWTACGAWFVADAVEAMASP